MKKWLLIILASVLASACAKKVEPEESCNFVQNGSLQRVSWKGQFPIEFYIHQDVPADYYRAIQSAMAQWEVRLRRPLFKIVGIDQGSDSNGSKDGRNVITMSNGWEPQFPNEQARTTIYWAGDLIYEADVRINASGTFQFSGLLEAQDGEVDMESLMVHELGHVLGLQHNDTNPSVMATTLAAATLRREPKASDIKSLQCEYN
jgi:hypothetical protein